MQSVSMEMPPAEDMPVSICARDCLHWRGGMIYPAVKSKKTKTSKPFIIAQEFFFVLVSSQLLI